MRHTCVIDIESEGLEPWKGRIICIGAMDLESRNIIQFHGDNEKEMLEEFFSWFHNNGYQKVIGYNVMFDFRYLFGRAMKYGITANSFFRRSIVIDVMKTLKSVQNMWSMNKPGKLDQWSELCFGSGKIELGESVPELYRKGKIGEILTYNAHDVKITADLYNRTKMVLGDVS